VSSRESRVMGHAGHGSKSVTHYCHLCSGGGFNISSTPVFNTSRAVFLSHHALARSLAARSVRYSSGLRGRRNYKTFALNQNVQRRLPARQKREPETIKHH